ncbi:hypothetical protein RvY_13935 [Ramazzottius varieornatus]|uniref:Uncharacterized protein n=1 Tax=Ramazzottius varieornatus TaxID=947166 RepID=A0A1D1VUS0_RAMVA|nr:hypothetical protein RvY_13935 [Ramazzottius varieornatus]
MLKGRCHLTPSYDTHFRCGPLFERRVRAKSTLVPTVEFPTVAHAHAEILCPVVVNIFRDARAHCDLSASSITHLHYTYTESSLTRCSPQQLQLSAFHS